MRATGPSDKTDLHKAVRAGVLDQIETLLNGHADINAKDSTGRTPLTLALQLGNHPAAKMLLARDASINLNTDVGFIDEDLAPYFRTALLKTQLVLLSEGDPQSVARSFLADVSRNQMVPPTKSIWQFSCDNCPNPHPIPGTINGAAMCAVDPTIVDGPAVISNGQWTFTYILDEPTISPCGGPPRMYTPSGNLDLPKCQPGNTPVPCFPAVVITNQGGQSPLSLTVIPFVLSDPGTCTPPPTGVSLQGSAAILAPGASLTVDRSLADITVHGSMVSSATFNLAFKVLPQVPPDTSVSTKLDPVTRLNTYVRLAQFREIYDGLLLSTCQTDNIARITADTARRAISANAVIAQYVEHLKQEIFNLALDIAQFNNNLVYLSQVLAANALLPPDQIKLMIVQTNQLLQDPQLSADDKADLTSIRDELTAAQSAVSGGAAAIAIFHDKYSSFAESKVVQYQGDVLEYAQYIPPSTLASNSILTAATRDQVNKKILSADVLIPDSADEGNGQAIRAAFRGTKSIGC
jgi:hypothetical protein